MSLAPPRLLTEAQLRAQQGVDVLAAEMLADKAAALGHHGRLVEEALARLRACEEPDETRLQLVRAAAREAWAFLVQRELCGLRDQQEIIRLYGIPPEVLVRLGAMER